MNETNASRAKVPDIIFDKISVEKQAKEKNNTKMVTSTPTANLNTEEALPLIQGSEP